VKRASERVSVKRVVTVNASFVGLMRCCRIEVWAPLLLRVWKISGALWVGLENELRGY
jgi:hypothetical protein